MNTSLFLKEIHRGLGCLCLIILGVKHAAENGKDKVLGFANHKQHQLLLFISCSQNLVATKRFPQAHFLGNAYDGFAIE